MQILRDILNSLSIDAPISEVRRGLHWTAVVSRHCGLASTMLQDLSCCNDDEEDMIGPKTSFTEMSGLELSEFCLWNDVPRASLGIAALNSLIDFKVDDTEDIDGLQLIQSGVNDKNVSVIGHFPDLKRLAAHARNLWIIERRPLPGDISEGDGQRYLAQSDVVVISGTTLINHTLTGILDFCRKESVKMLLGPSTPMTPVFFDHGIDILAGSFVTKQETVLKHLSEGAGFRRLKRTGGIRFVTMIKDRDVLRRLG